MNENKEAEQSDKLIAKLILLPKSWIVLVKLMAESQHKTAGALIREMVYDGIREELSIYGTEFLKNTYDSMGDDNRKLLTLSFASKEAI